MEMYKKFLRFINRYNPEFSWKDGIAVALLVMAHVLYYCISLMVPMLVSILIDWVLPDYNSTKLIAWTGFSVLVYIAYHFTDGLLIGYLNFEYEILLEQKMTMTLLKRTLEKPIYIFDKYSDGYIYNLVFQDSVNVVSVSGQMLIRVISISISLCITLAILWNIAPFLFFIELMMIPAIVAATLAFQPKLERLQRMQRNSLDDVHSNIQNILKSKKSIQLTKREPFFVEQVRKYYKPYIERVLRYWRAFFCATVLPEFIVNLGNVVLLTSAALLYVDGQISLGVLVLAGTITSRVVMQIQNLLTCYLRRIANHVGFERMDEFANSVDTPEIFQFEDTKQRGIDLADVDVTVGDRLLYNVGFFSSGETGLIQITGENGSGKSTLFNLLLGVSRFDGLKVADDGFIKIPADFFKKCSYFSSPNILMEETVRNNILLGREATDKFCEVCRMLNIDFLDKTVTTRPINLSFGEQQKVFLARALCGEESVLFLDEPMVNLDIQTKEALVDYLSMWKKQQLIIIISHEASLEDVCDEIYQIQDRRLVKVK